MDVKVKIDSAECRKSDKGFAQVLENAYATKQRPLCLCRTSGVPMYIAKAHAKYILKRMPNSGAHHAPDCESYEAPSELSGFGDVMGRAIQENADDGLTTLKLDFALSKQGKRGPIASGAETEKESVRTDGNKLTLRGLLHYLWSQAGFDKWTPAMAGKRSWFVLRKYLLEAANHKQAKGLALSNILYIPESFSSERKEDIERRQKKRFAEVFGHPSGSKEHLMLLIGEVKEFAAARYGQKLTVKHLPNTPFMLNDDIAKRINTVFADELALWNYLEQDAHLIVIATFGKTPSGFLTVEQLALMVSTAQWLPIENLSEFQLVKTLVDDGRRFIKGLRVNMDSTKPLASALLVDTGVQPIALFIRMNPNDSDDYAAAFDHLISESKLPCQVWDVDSDTALALPPVHATQPTQEDVA